MLKQVQHDSSDFGFDLTFELWHLDLLLFLLSLFLQLIQDI